MRRWGRGYGGRKCLRFESLSVVETNTPRTLSLTRAVNRRVGSFGEKTPHPWVNLQREGKRCGGAISSRHRPPGRYPPNHPDVCSTRPLRPRRTPSHRPLRWRYPTPSRPSVRSQPPDRQLPAASPVPPLPCRPYPYRTPPTALYRNPVPPQRRSEPARHPTRSCYHAATLPSPVGPLSHRHRLPTPQGHRVPQGREPQRG